MWLDRRSTAIAILTLLTALGLALRLWGIDSRLPHAVEPDTQFVQQAAIFRGQIEPDTKTYGAYPHLLGRVQSLWPAAESRAPLDLAHQAEHLAVAGGELQRGRVLSCLLSLIAIPCTWALARRWLSSAAALLAAAALALCLLGFDFAQQARPHAAFESFAALTLVAALRARERGDARSWALWGLCLFLGLGCLHTGVFLLPTGLCAAALRPRGAPGCWRAAAAASALATGAALLCFYPFVYAPPEASAEMLGQTVSGRFPHAIYADRFDGGGFASLGRALLGYDPWLAWGALFGALASLLACARGAWRCAELRASALVLLSFALPYALVIGSYSNSYERFLLPLLPLLACLAAAGVVLIARAAERRWPRAALPWALGLAALALALPGARLLRYAWLRAQPDTHTRAAQWLAEHEPQARATLLIEEGVALPLIQRYSRAQAQRLLEAPFTGPWALYLARRIAAGQPVEGWAASALMRADYRELGRQPEERELERVRALVARRGANYLVVRADRGAPELRALKQALAPVANCVARFPEPGQGREPLGMQYQHDDFWWRAWNAQACGLELEIYRIAAR